eukprot:1429551-Heterocapsa_arctica.AAC.1
MPTGYGAHTWNMMWMKEELANCKERTTSISEWGGYEHIIMWSKIFQINIEIHCYRMNMQTLDGDEFTQD